MTAGGRRRHRGWDRSVTVEWTRDPAKPNFVVPITRLRFADKFLAVAGPKACKSLPQTVRNVESKHILS